MQKKYSRIAAHPSIRPHSPAYVALSGRRHAYNRALTEFQVPLNLMDHSEGEQYCKCTAIKIQGKQVLLN